MSVLVATSQKVGADTAGVTGGVEHSVAPTASPVESFRAVVESSAGALGDLWAGGFHPEGAPVSVDTHQPITTAIPGRLGGLKARSQNLEHSIATAQPLEVAASTGRETVALATSTIARLRSRLRI